MFRHLLQSSELTSDDIQLVFRLAKSFRPKIDQGESVPLLRGKTVVNFFYENSTRTRISFDVATRKLGGGTLNFSASGSSVAKGETLTDTARTLEANHSHCLVVRHSCAGSPGILAEALSMPVINAGDGFHDHPTQGLLDSFTMQEKLGDLKGKRIVIIGDIAHSRVARANIRILHKLGASVAVCGPPTLLPPNPKSLGVDFAYRPEALIREADVVMALRIQLERHGHLQIPSMEEYSHFWGINAKRAQLMKPEAILMHPGPINRGVELDPEVADSSRSVILNQVSNGYLVRMAVLAIVCNPKGVEEYLSQGGDHA